MNILFWRAVLAEMGLAKTLFSDYATVGITDYGSEDSHVILARQTFAPQQIIDHKNKSRPHFLARANVSCC